MKGMAEIRIFLLRCYGIDFAPIKGYHPFCFLCFSFFPFFLFVLWSADVLHLKIELDIEECPILLKCESKTKIWFREDFKIKRKCKMNDIVQKGGSVRKSQILNVKIKIIFNQGGGRSNPVSLFQDVFQIIISQLFSFILNSMFNIHISMFLGDLGFLCFRFK